jgi:very-short-patch-repair endonuclease
MKTRGVSEQARLLHSALLQRNVDAEIEKWDGHKHIDIAIVPAKLDIEVDGDEHYTNVDRLEADLRREYYSEEKGYDTIHIPNLVVEHHLDAVADAIAELVQRRLS